jgi:hypothetical protein
MLPLQTHHKPAHSMSVVLIRLALCVAAVPAGTIGAVYGIAAASKSYHVFA